MSTSDIGNESQYETHESVCMCMYVSLCMCTCACVNVYHITSTIAYTKLHNKKCVTKQQDQSNNCSVHVFRYTQHNFLPMYF